MPTSSPNFTVKILSLLEWLDALVDFHVCFSIHPIHWGYKISRRQWQARAVSQTWTILNFVVKGECRMWINGKEWVITPDMALLLAPNVKRDVQWPPLYIFNNLWFSLEKDGVVLKPDIDIRVVKAPRLRPFINELNQCVSQFHANAKNPYWEKRIRHLLFLIFGDILQLGKERLSENPSCLTPQQQDCVEHLIQSNPKARISSRDLAKELHLSPDYMARVFRATYGVSPRRWLLRKRLQAAASELEYSDLNVSEVASEFGYSNFSQFSQQFKAEFGRTPSEYRKAPDK